MNNQNSVAAASWYQAFAEKKPNTEIFQEAKINKGKSFKLKNLESFLAL